MKTWPVWGLMLLIMVNSTPSLGAPVSNKSGVQKVCYEWIQPFYDFLTLKEGRNMRRSDLSRFFSYMDNTLNGKVSLSEFKHPWQGATQMTTVDTRMIFNAWAIIGERSDPSHINEKNQAGIWSSFHPKKDTDTVTRQDFAKSMEKMMTSLPNKGCTDGRFHSFD